MKDLTQEASLLYSKTLDSYLATQYSYKNNDEGLYLAFLDSHFIRVNNLVSSCNYLASIGYADESNILTRTTLEAIIDFVMAIGEMEFIGEDVIERRINRIKKYYKHQKLYTTYSLKYSGDILSQMGIDSQTKEKKEKEYKNNFSENGRTFDKWYCMSLPEAINKCSPYDDTLMIIYKMTCFYVHNNYMIFDKRNEFEKYSDSLILQAIYCYHRLYNSYIKFFIKATPDKNLFIEESNILLDKIENKLKLAKTVK